MGVNAPLSKRSAAVEKFTLLRALVMDRVFPHIERDKEGYRLQAGKMGKMHEILN